MPTTTLTYEQAMQLAPEQEFFSGTPPEIGWWMCKQAYTQGSALYTMRWWNGKFWSVRIVPSDWRNMDSFAKIPGETSFAEVQYCARFWEGK